VYRGILLERRKVQLVGGSTYIVSLPKKWARELGLSSGDPVGIVPQADGSLILVPRPSEREARPETRIELDESTRQSWIAREIISSYLNGFERILICSRSQISPAQRSEIIRVERKLVGLETVEETANEVVLESLLRIQDLEVWRGIARAHAIAASMQKDSVGALIQGDEQLARDVIKRDDEVDRLYFLIIRQLRLAAKNPEIAYSLSLRPIDCLDLQSAIKRIEHIADHAQNIAERSKPLSGQPLPPPIRDDLLTISGIARSIYEGAGRSLLDGDLSTANQVVNRRSEMKAYCSKFRKSLLRLDLSRNLALNAVVDSLERIADYGTDIAEVVINRGTQEEAGGAGR